jgi:hypothetical protein
MKWFTVLVLAVCVGCGGWWPPIPPPEPQPTPTPEPTPTPTPEPPPEPVCSPGGCDCYHKPPGEDWQWIDCPDPEPPPFDWEECEARYESGVCLDGVPEMGSYWYQDRILDATPKIRNRARCEYYGFYYNGQPRQGCPTVLDGDPRRLASERELMGGDRPVYRTTGDLTCVIVNNWFCKVRGTEGTVQACYPNGKACALPRKFPR